MPVVDDSIIIDRPREQVWEFATDPANILLTNSNLLEFEPITDGPMAKGSRFRGVVKVAGKRIDWTTEITEFEPPHRLAYRAVESAIPFSIDITYEEVDGGTKLVWHQEADSYGGFFGKLADPVVTRMYAKDVRANLESTKEVLEAGA